MIARAAKSKVEPDGNIPKKIETKKGSLLWQCGTEKVESNAPMMNVKHLTK